MKLRRNSREIPGIFARARNVRVYSMDNCFVGKSMVDNPIDPDAWPKAVKHTTQSDFLAIEFRRFRFSRLTRNNGTFTLHIHSNLWYEFEN